MQQRVLEPTGVRAGAGGPDHALKKRRVMGYMEILIISGLSGGGKSKAASFLEDMGFYIVDNMPAAMILKFAEFCAGGSGRYDRVALVYDVRTGQLLYGAVRRAGPAEGHGVRRAGCCFWRPIAGGHHQAL